MATKGETPVSWALPAAADLRGSQYHAVTINTSKQVALASNPFTDFYLGVLAGKPKSGEHATVEKVGITKGHMGGPITLGDHLTYTTSGFFVKGNAALPRTTAQSGTTEFINSAYALVGEALETVASGAIGTMFTPGHVYTIIQSN